MLHILSQQMVLHLNHIMEVRQLSWVACKEGNVQSDAGPLQQQITALLQMNA